MKRKEITGFLGRNKNFSLLWASQMLSQIMTNIINFVMVTRIYEKTGSTIAVSLLWIFYILPSFLLGPFSGLVVDMTSLRKILLYTNFLQGFVILLFLFAKNNVYSIYPVVFLYSLLNQFYFPAEASSLIWLVRKKDLSLANSLFLLTSQSSLIAGLAISGILMRLFGKNNPIYISAAGLFLAGLAVYFLPKTEPPHVHKKIGDFSKFFSEIKAGYSFIVNHRTVLFPIVVLTFFQVFLVVMGISIPSLASRLLNIEVQDAGPVLIIPLGLGALLGTYILSRFFRNLRKKEILKKGLLIAFFVFISFAFILPFLGWYKIILAVILMFILGIGGLFIFIPSQILLQENIPPMLRGRVFGTLGFISTALILPVLLFSATFVDTLGIGLFMFIPAMVMLVALTLLKKAEQMIYEEKNGNH